MYRAFKTEPGFSYVATIEEIVGNGSNLSIPLYVRRESKANGENGTEVSLKAAWEKWEKGSRAFWQQMDSLVEMLDKLQVEGGARD